MQLSDPISDFLTRIKNAARARNEECRAPHSRIKEQIARVLKEEGYLWRYEVDRSGKFPELRLHPRYGDDGGPALADLKRVSRPGRRSYVGADEIPPVLGGLGISLLSTSRGIMAGHKARKERIGGELLAYVW